MKNQKLCKFKKSEIKENLTDIVKLVAKPKYICLNCGRVAKKDKVLCNSLEIKGN